MSKACVFLADGFEEVEAITPIDLMRRAGIEVTTVSVQDIKTAFGRSGIGVTADELFENVDYDKYDMLVFPGGMPGTTNLEEKEELLQLARSFYADGKKIAAICAAPMIFGHMGLLDGKRATIYSGMEAELIGATPVDANVVTDENITTSKGAGTAVDFALELIRVLEGEDNAEDVKNEILYNK